MVRSVVGPLFSISGAGPWLARNPWMNASLAVIAEAVGYQSEAALSRANH
jgi:hypothetical protein